MMENKEVKKSSESTFNHFADYVDNFYKLSVVKGAAKTSGIGSGIITTVIFYSFVMMLFFWQEQHLVGGSETLLIAGRVGS